MKKILLSIIAVATAICGSYPAAAATVGDKYVKVTSTTDLTADDEYILCYETNAMGAQSGKFRSRIENGVTINGNQATIASADVAAFTLVNGTTSGSFAFKFSESEYLSCTGTSNNSLANSTTLAKTCDMTITISNGAATIIPVENSNTNKNKIQYNKNAGQERFSNYKTGTQQNCTLYKKDNSTPSSVANPTFTPAAGTYYETQTVTIACATEGATLTYSTDGENFNDYTGAITVDHSMTITAKATLGTDEATAKAEYIIKEAVNATSITDAYTRMDVASLASNAETDEFTVAFEPVVTYVNGGNVFIHDGEKYGLIFKYSSGLAAGDKIAANWQSTIKNYNGLYEFIPAADLAANGTADIPAPVEITPAQLTADNQSMTVVMNGVVFATATPAETATGSARTYKGTVDGTEITLFNNFKNASVEAGTYNVTGIIGVYGTTPQLQPISFEKVEIVETKCATPTFSHQSGIVTKGTEVTITCSTEGSKLMLFVDEEAIECETNTYTVTINQDTDISAWAEKEGLESSDIAEASYLVNEQGGDDPVEGTAIFKTPACAANVEGTEISNGANGDLIGESFSSTPISIKFTANSPANNVGLFNSDKEVRWYANNFITVTPNQGYIIEEVYVNTVSNSKGNFGVTVDGKETGTVSGTGSGASNPITWTGSSNKALLLTPNAQVRFNYISVKYKTDTTGVDDINADDANAPVEYYNLQGIRVSNPNAGVYIRRQGNNVTKVLVK